MSGESGKAVEVPVPSNSSSTLPVPTAPPKRFLGASHTASQRKNLSGSLGSSPLPPALVIPVLRIQPTSTASIVSPPKLTRYPTLLLTPVDITKLPGREVVRSSSIASSVTSPVLPPPPPLIKMPLSTRKDKRVAAAAAAISTARNEETESTVEDTDNPQEPPRKRSRAAAEKSVESSSPTGGGVVTPRKIIQEIFGPDKSKKPKGKGRKKRRGAPTPRKKVLQDEPTAVEPVEEEDNDNNEEEGGNEDQANVEDESRDVEELEVEYVDAVKDKEEEKVGDEEEMPNLELEQEDNVIEEVDLTEDSKSETGEVEEEEQEEATVVVSEEEEQKSEEQQEEKVLEQNENDKDSEKSDEGENEEENQGENEIEEPEEPEEKPQILPRRASRRKAKSIAKEKLKRLSKCEDVDGNRKGTSSTGTPEDQEDEVEEVEEEEKGQKEEEKDEEEDDDDNSSETKEETGGPASIHSRRSTTEGSSKSFGSSIQLDLESSYHHPHFHHHLNKFNGHDEDGYRQKFNPTPLSLISEDDDEGPLGDNVSEESDMQDQKDSDVDSTYSWKPVRAAAAAALEQVTKNQGSASGDLGDAEAKAAAAAERRARKIMRYKGRNRRSLLFKSSGSKRYTAVRNNRYSAQPTVAPKVYHHGHYFQAGDIVSVELADSTHIHGQVRGLIMDHFGEISAGIRFLAPKHPTYALMDFEPHNYAFRYDMPEKLVKIEYIEFVMHLNLDYFDGQPSFSKIEKGTMYTRIGKTMHSHHPNELDNISSAISGRGSSSSSSSSSTSSSEDSDDSSTTSSDSENDENKEKDEKKKLKGERHRHLTDSSTDADAEVEEDNDTVDKNDDAHENKPCVDADDVKIKDEIENRSSPVIDNDTKVEVEIENSV